MVQSQDFEMECHLGVARPGVSFQSSQLRSGLKKHWYEFLTEVFRRFEQVESAAVYGVAFSR